MKRPLLIQLALLVAALTPGCDSTLGGGTTDLAGSMDGQPPQAVDGLPAMDGAPADGARSTRRRPTWHPMRLQPLTAARLPAR